MPKRDRHRDREMNRHETEGTERPTDKQTGLGIACREIDRRGQKERAKKDGTDRQNKTEFQTDIKLSQTVQKDGQSKETDRKQRQTEGRSREEGIDRRRKKGAGRERRERKKERRERRERERERRERERERNLLTYNYDRLHHSNQLLVCSSVALFG